MKRFKSLFCENQPVDESNEPFVENHSDEIFDSCFCDDNQSDDSYVGSKSLKQRTKKSSNRSEKIFSRNNFFRRNRKKHQSCLEKPRIDPPTITVTRSTQTDLAPMEKIEANNKEIEVQDKDNTKSFFETFVYECVERGFCLRYAESTVEKSINQDKAYPLK